MAEVVGTANNMITFLMFTICSIISPNIYLISAANIDRRNVDFTVNCKINF